MRRRRGGVGRGGEGRGGGGGGDEPAPVSDLARALTDAGIATCLQTKPREAYRPASEREASSRDSPQLVVIGNVDTVYRSKEPIYESQAYLRVPKVNIAGPAEGKV